MLALQQDGLPWEFKESAQRCWSLRLCSKTGRVNTRISQKSGKFSRLNWGDKQLLTLSRVKKQGICSVCALVHFCLVPSLGSSLIEHQLKNCQLTQQRKRMRVTHRLLKLALAGVCHSLFLFLPELITGPCLSGDKVQSYYVLRRNSRKMFWTALMMFTAINTAHCM